MKFLHILLMFLAIVWAKDLDLTHANIFYQGASFSNISSNKILFQRHSDSALAGKQWIIGFDATRARTTSGIGIKFITKSSKFSMTFQRESGYNLFGQFAILIDGQDSKRINFNPKASGVIKIDYTLPTDGQEHTVEVYLPPFANVSLSKISIDDNSQLEIQIPAQTQKYLAIGNSISHGMGQHNTIETFPYLLAQANNWELQNLAVGGSSTSLTMANMVRDEIPEVHHITMMYGYNDFYYKEYSVDEFKSLYLEFIQTIRQKHLNTKIYAISAIVSKNSSSKSGKAHLLDFQTAVDTLVDSLIQAGDQNLFLIKGREITRLEDLSDGIHLSKKGARAFADSLILQVKKFNKAQTTSLWQKTLHSAPWFNKESRVYNVQGADVTLPHQENQQGAPGAYFSNF